MTKMRTAIVCLTGILLAISCRAQEAQPQPATGKQTIPDDPDKASTSGNAVKADPILATVNGEAIHQSDLLAGSRQNMFGVSLDKLKEMKLERLIEASVIKQLLKSKKVEISEAEIDAQVAELKKVPPAAGGCACCRYPSLADFMEANAYDMKELRQEIANNLGFEKLMTAQWDEQYPAGEKREALLKAEQAKIEGECVKASQIFFMTFQKPEFKDNPDKVSADMRKNAEAAWNRLKKGEAFADVAKQVSEDTLSKPKGGELGVIPRTAFGKETAAVLAKLKPGEYSEPVESPWGFHIFLREAITPEDILASLRDDFMTKHWEEEKDKAIKTAKIERLDKKSAK